MIYRCELVEDRDRTKELGNLEFQKVSATPTMLFMWRMAKLLWLIGKTVIMYSGFYVFRELIWYV